jgi:DNA-binding NarL/FixJ family response regulator
MNGALISVLRPRAAQVVRLLATGLSIKEAAHEMSISATTASNYLDAARKKMNVRTTHQLLYVYGTEQALLALENLVERINEQKKTSRARRAGGPGAFNDGQPRAGTIC